MSDDQPAAEVDVTKEWRATQGQKSAATRLRIFAAIAWVVAIGGEVAGIVFLRQGRFDQGNLPLLIGILAGIAIFAISTFDTDYILVQEETLPAALQALAEAGHELQ